MHQQVTLASAQLAEALLAEGLLAEGLSAELLSAEVACATIAHWLAPPHKGQRSVGKEREPDPVMRPR